MTFPGSLADIPTEQTIVGSVAYALASFDALQKVVTPGDFFDSRHRLIWSTMGLLAAKGKPTNVKEVAAELHASGRLDAAGGSEYLGILDLETPAFGNLQSLAERIADLGRKRRALAIIDDAAVHGRNGIQDTKSWISTVSSQLSAIACNVSSPTDVPSADDPLRSLECLSRVAVVGRQRFLQLASIPIEYIWQDLVVAGTIVGIAGPPAGGKTTLVFLVIAGRLNTGEPVELLGHLLTPAPAGQWVVLIEGEHSEPSAARKLIGSFELLGIESDGLDRLILVARKAVRLGSPEWFDVVRMVRAGLVSDIALDTVARVAPANADNEAEQVAIFDSVARAIEEAPEGCQPTVWAIMHTRKGEGSTLEDVSGSTQRTGQADSVFLLKAEKTDGRIDEVKVTFAKLRETPDDYPEPAVFAIRKNSAGKRELHCGAQPAPSDDRPLEERILEQLQVMPRTKSWLASHLKKNKAAVDDALTNLFSARRIRTCEVQFNGRPYKAFEPSTNVGRTPFEEF